MTSSNKPSPTQKSSSSNKSSLPHKPSLSHNTSISQKSLPQNPQSHIRNFAIIAHIDHGKSTLADRLIQFTGGLSKREMTPQILDSMSLEKERGITIKAQTVRLDYQADDGQTYQLNLIDTPGHVDFVYEVSRSLAACEGSLLVVDASQGVEAQTLANVYQAIDQDHEILIALNKIDLPASEPEKICKEIEDVIGLDTKHMIKMSAKTGEGVKPLLEAIVRHLPAPQNFETKKLRCLLIDSWYDSYLGVVVLVRVVNGKLRKGQKIRMFSNNISYQIERVGIFSPKQKLVETLQTGEIGFFTASIKEVSDMQIGDTITDDQDPCEVALEGFNPSKSVVFCGLFPIDSSQFEDLRSAMAKLRLNDASFTYDTENSKALGFGFRCGFLGLLHLEIIKERLTREFNIELITTAPSVVYQVTTQNNKTSLLHNPADMPAPDDIKSICEPWIKASILMPQSYMGGVLKLCEERRGVQVNMSYVGGRMLLEYELPLNEVVFDFYDRLKSISKGYASFDYQLLGFRPERLVKLSILVNHETVDALAMIVHITKAETKGRQICERLKDLIPRHLFKIPIQAALYGKIIARETIPALRKDVTAKCYGGDATRKRKLLDRQKKGKKKMRQFGKVSIPQSVFLSALKMDDE